MFEYILRHGTHRSLSVGVLTGSALAATLSLAACGDTKTDAVALKTDSALGRDLAMAAADSAAKPKLQDVPEPSPPAPTPPAPAAAPASAPTKSPAPRRTPTPKAAPAAPRPAPAAAPTPAAPAAPAALATGVVAAGTVLKFASNAKVCSNSAQIGDRFTGELSEAVPASNGVTIPVGAVGVFEVTQLRTAQSPSDSTYLHVRLISVQYGGKTYAVDATVQTAATERFRSASTSSDAKKVAGGAVIGGIIGQVIGKNTKGTVIGAAAGAAAGTAAAAATGNYDTCLNSGAAVSVKLDAPASVRATAAP